jgi:hypothetical protein
VSKDHHGEWADHRILAEIEESDTPAGVLYTNHLAADALVFAYGGRASAMGMHSVSNDAGNSTVSSRSP